MSPIVPIHLVSCVVAAMLASAILSYDPGQRANRLIAAMIVGSAYWSLCEVLWNVQSDPEVVLWLVKASGLAWPWLGALTLDFYVEVQAEGRSRLRRLVPGTYAFAAVAVVLYVSTPWFVADVHRTSWGWSYSLTPAFWPLYSVVLVPVTLVLTSWPRFFSRGSARERRQARLIFAAIAAPLAVASFTDAIAPGLGWDLPRLGAPSLLAMGAAVAWSVRRHGYFLMAPGAFAREVVESLPDGVALVEADARIRTCNEGLERLVGLARGELDGTSISELVPELRGLPVGAVEEYETELVNSLGERIAVSISSSPLEDADGARLGAVLAIHDLREVAALRSRLVTSGRLAAVGELAAGIAHEIANPVTYVRANLVQLREHWQALAAETDAASTKPDLEAVLAEGEELLDESIEGVERVAGIVRNVGTFSHAGLGRSENVNVNVLLDHAVGVAVLSFSVLVERNFSDLPPVQCDPQELKQVFLNLLLNSLQAMGDHGHIRLVTEARDGWVGIRVSDDGPGIPEEAMDRIFDPFFTTHRSGENLGLGLAHCYQTVRNLGGEISAESVPGAGTTFEIRLPGVA